jgi:predicted nucleic acid-binding protein
MPDDRAFFDTNILVYAFSEDDSRREKARSLLMTGGTVGVQTLNEFVNTQRGKAKLPWPDISIRLRLISELCLPPIALTQRVHMLGLEIAQSTGYHIYDSLMLAAAMEADCTVFYSEDLQDGQTIEGLTIRNPFV